MRAVFAWALACSVVGMAWLTTADAAHADEAMRAMIREEVAAYLAQEGAGASADKNTFKVYWKNGLRLDTHDGNVKLKIGGRIMVDAGFWSDSDLENVGINLRDGAEFRRLRLYNAGQIGKHVRFKAQLDFADGNVGYRDVYIELAKLHDCFFCGMPNIRVGHFFEPFGLEAPTSSKYITFMERAAATNAFSPSRNTGLALHDSLLGDQLNWGVGIFGGRTPGEEGDEGANLWVDDGYGISGRISYAPLWDCDCDCKRLFVGVSGTMREDLDHVRFRARPGLHITDTRLVDTGNIAGAESYWTAGADIAWVNGPWSVQAEYFHTQVESAVANDPTFSGYYGYITYNLSGSCRPFKHGRPGRSSVCCDWLDEDCCCKGGWELAARYDFIDLTDGAVVGGEQTAITLGLNWYVNANTRVMFNAVFGDVTDGRGFINETYTGYGVRFQIDW